MDRRRQGDEARAQQEPGDPGHPAALLRETGEHVGGEPDREHAGQVRHGRQPDREPGDHHDDGEDDQADEKDPRRQAVRQQDPQHVPQREDERVGGQGHQQQEAGQGPGLDGTAEEPAHPPQQAGDQHGGKPARGEGPQPATEQHLEVGGRPAVQHLGDPFPPVTGPDVEGQEGHADEEHQHEVPPPGADQVPGVDQGDGPRPGGELAVEETVVEDQGQPDQGREDEEEPVPHEAPGQRRLRPGHRQDRPQVDHDSTPAAARCARPRPAMNAR